MHQLKVSQLFSILQEHDPAWEFQVELEINPTYLKGKGEVLLEEVFGVLGGLGAPVTLEKLKFDFKINRFVFVFDDEVHFNRYRLETLKTAVYESFTYPWVESYKRLCRTYEKECLKSGARERVWFGPPIAEKLFGQSENPGDLSGRGASGWRLNAYNDVQYDLFSRLHGFKLIRIPMYENLMVGGTLVKIDDLLLQPKESQRQAIRNWMLRKVQ